MIIIENKDKCSGCYSCSNSCPTNCISMVCDEEGFWYPEYDEKVCIKCGLCVKNCPIIYNNEKNVREPVAYAAYSLDEEVRLKSSSGGLFSLFAEEILNQNGVVFGATFDDSFNVIHEVTDNKDNLFKFRGSKYVQSKIGDTFKEVKIYLENDKKVLFTGTPCQIAGLKSFLVKEHENLFCQDIICHGVPSPKVWRKYFDFIEKSSDKLVNNITFRAKYEGWKNYSVSFQFDDNSNYTQKFQNDDYMKSFLNDISLRPSCYNCSFKSVNRQSDFTLADFWGIQNIKPEMDDDKGTSLLIVNSEKGKELFDKIKFLTNHEKVDLFESIKFNPSMNNSVSLNKKRKLFFKDLDKLRFDELVNKYCKISLKTRIKILIYKILKKIKHIVYD